MELNPEFAREIEKLKARQPSKCHEIDALVQQILQRPTGAAVAWQDDLIWITVSLREEERHKASGTRAAKQGRRKPRRDRYRGR